MENDKFLNDLSSYIKTCFDNYDASSTRAKVIANIKSSREAYNQEAADTDFPWEEASNLVTPLTAIAVNEMEPRLVSAVIGKEPWIKAEANRGVSTDEEAVQVTKFDNYVLKNDVKLEKVVRKAVHELLLDGTIYPMLSWERKERKVRKTVFDPTTGQVLPQQIVDAETGEVVETRMMKQDVNVVTFEGVEISLVSVEHIWHSDDISDATWENETVIRYLRPYAVGELKRLAATQDGWLLPDNIDVYAGTKKLLTSQQEADEVSEEPSSVPTSKLTIECLEAYLNWALEEDGEEEPIIVTVLKDDFKVVRIRRQIDVVEHNLKPLRRLCLMERSGIGYGFPIYSIVAGLQLGLDAMFNRCINSADITMTPWGFFKRGLSGAEVNRLSISPGTLFGVDNPEAFVFPNLSGFRPESFINLINLYVSFFERSINVSDMNQGRPSEIAGKRGVTATGTLAILQEGKIQHEYRGAGLLGQFLDIIIFVHDLYAGNMPQEKMIAVTGSVISKYTMSKDYTFALVGSDMTSNKFIDRKTIEDMIMTSTPFMSMMNPMKLAEDMIRSYSKEPEDYIDPELNQVVTQFLQRRDAIKAMAQVVGDEGMAAQLVDQGLTPDDVMKLAKGAGQQLGKAEGGTNEQQS